jgi:Spy/CpxP family protein refolding chaperone
LIAALPRQLTSQIGGALIFVSRRLHRREASMRKFVCLGLLACCLLFAVPALSAEQEQLRPSVPEELTDAWERFQRALQEWGGRVWERFGGRGPRENQPAISQMLSHKDALGLSADQVRKLEQLRDDFQRQSIRNDADLRIVELDIAGLLEKEPVEMAKLEGKIREAEKLRADIRITRIRAIEQARALLTTDQKKKLEDLNRSMLSPRPPRAGQNPSAT